MSSRSPDRQGGNPVSAADPAALTGLLAKSARRGRPEERLTDHLWATLRAAEVVLRRTGRVEVAEGIFRERFRTTVALAALYHDVGKVPAGFQDMLVRAVRYGERHEVLSLGFLPWLIEDPDLLLDVATAVVTHHRSLTDTSGRSITTLYGLDTSDDFRGRFDRVPADGVLALVQWLRATAQAAGLPVRSAEGPEGKAATSRPNASPKSTPTIGHQLADAAHDTLQRVLDRWEEPNEEDGLAAVLLQGAVTTADRLSSAHQDLHLVQPLGKGLPKLVERHLAARSGGTIRPHQQEAGAVSGHLVLRAPTGSGKTEAVLLWASRQVQEIEAATGATPRVYYTLPYLASINAMTDRLADLLGTHDAIGVSHSRAASYYLATGITPEDGDCSDSGAGLNRADAAVRAVARAAATRLYRETVRVGTPYQLLRAALAGTEYSGVLLDTANSVFILDELHAYDPQRLGYILASMALWNRLGGRIAVLSATLPHVLLDLLKDTLHTLTPLPQPDAGPPARHRVGAREHHLTDAAALDEIRERLSNGESVLVVANNVADATELYEALAPAAREAGRKHGHDPGTETATGHTEYGPPGEYTAPCDRSALLLHSRFRRLDRNAIEVEIRKRFGTGAERRGGLVITTQVVEVSLDVDFDVLFTSAAPLEALLQRFGRVNRTGARPPADVIVHEPAWVERRGAVSGVFADGIYPREPVAAGWAILRKHQGKVVDEDDATEWLNSVYDSEWGERWKQDVWDARRTFDRDFLSFRFPFEDREPLACRFDELFNGTEAVHSADVNRYREELERAPQAAGRLLADDLLIPLTERASRMARYDRPLRVTVIDGDYDPEFGLRSVRVPGAESTYALGEVL